MIQPRRYLSTRIQRRNTRLDKRVMEHRIVMMRMMIVIIKVMKKRKRSKVNLNQRRLMKKIK
jgi:hypothetical protein